VTMPFQAANDFLTISGSLLREGARTRPIVLEAGPAANY
jgi:hypothetical protein